ncbi:hypothetical protein F7725_016092 [Dissostichus mawsoni]|uniref:Uncharacterized protein n=1 Tax=Dissostichus mawsoni TaxID=36200 RepID=A0A7J5Y3M4_DISMA|nr:hypothetical protein F7725_016092 [Dissostichus mawsoni]
MRWCMRALRSSPLLLAPSAADFQFPVPVSCAEERRPQVTLNVVMCVYLSAVRWAGRGRDSNPVAPLGAAAGGEGRDVTPALGAVGVMAGGVGAGVFIIIQIFTIHVIIQFQQFCLQIFIISVIIHPSVRGQEKEMAKGKAKINGSALLQPRSLRSRKRECPSEEISETDDVQASRHQQDTEGSTSAVDAKLLQSHPTPVQESTIISPQQHEAEGLSSLTKQDPDTYEKHSEATHVEIKKTAVANHNNVSQPEEFKINAGNEGNNIQKNQGEMTAEECNRSPSQTCTDQLQVFLAISEEGDKAALDEQMGAKENSQCDSEKKQEAIQEEPSNVNMADVKELTKEAAVGLPAKKKRRMGMCGLTERERRHFLNTQKHGYKRQERVEKINICNNTADLVAQEEMISFSPLSSPSSIPAGSVTEQEEPDIQLESSHCGGQDREETEVLITVTTSDGTSAACDPMGESCEVEGVMAPGPEQTADTKSDPPPTEEEKEELLENPDQQEPEGSAAEIPAEKPQEPIEDGEDGSAAAEDQSPAITLYSNSTQNEETENGDAMEAAVLQVNSDTRTSEKKEELTGGAGDGVEEDPQSGGSNTVKLCEAAALPSGSERKDSVSDGTKCDGDKEHSAGSTSNAEPLQTWDTTDPFGSGYLDYVTDSQLNSISLSEVDVMEEEDLGSPDHEDATELICGLIRELSSLNRKVMATHRDLENLRSGSALLVHGVVLSVHHRAEALGVGFGPRGSAQGTHVLTQRLENQHDRGLWSTPNHQVVDETQSQTARTLPQSHDRSLWSTPNHQVVDETQSQTARTLPL